jgi:hypothetical protein
VDQRRARNLARLRPRRTNTRCIQNRSNRSGWSECARTTGRSGSARTGHGWRRSGLTFRACDPAAGVRRRSLIGRHVEE